MVINDENRAKINSVYRLMKRQTVTKKFIMTLFNVSERTAREIVSEIAQRAPVIALSNGEGYRVANIANPTDYADARHAYNENRKRAEEILKRNDALANALGLPKHTVTEVV